MVKKFLFFIFITIVFSSCERNFLKPLNRSSVYDPQSPFYDPTKFLVFTICLDKAEYKVGEDIILKIKLTNYGPSIDVWVLTMNLQPPTIEFELITPEGYILYPFEIGLCMVPWYIKLNHGESIEGTYNLAKISWCNYEYIKNEVYTLKNPGSYYIRAKYVPSEDFFIARKVILSNKLGFKIIP